MQNVLLKAGSFVLIMLAGYLLKKIGLFSKDENRTIMKLIMNVTLPAAVITSFSSYQRDMSLLLIFFLGLGLNLVMIGTGYLTFGKSRKDRAFGMINYSGYNIGTFTLPYLQSFLGNTGTIVACLFDSGNAIMCTGATYALASSVAGGSEEMGVRGFFKKLFSSLPFDTYLVMVIFYIFDLRFPAPVYTVTAAFGSANTFLAMFMIGGAFELCTDLKKLKSIAKVLVLRYGMAVVIAAGCYFLLPFSLEIRQILMIICFAPVSAMCVIFTERIGGNTERAGIINSMSILISLTVITALVSFWKLGA